MEAGTEQSDRELSRARRTARARQVRRRRRTAFGVLVGVLAVTVAAIVALGGGGGAKSTPAKASARKHLVSTSLVKYCLTPYRAESAPILEYHVIAPAPVGAGFPLLYVAQGLLRRQLDALAAHGYHAVTLDQLWANWHEHKRLPCGKPVVVSFDNGYETQFQYAEPVLAKLGWVGDENLQVTGLSWANGGISHHEIRELIKDGWELDTQGWSHASLTAEDTSGLRYQVAHARHYLQRHFHVPVNWFCYPSGEYNLTVIDELKADGFRGSTTEVNGWAGPNDDPYALPRLEVQPTMSPRELVQIVADMRGDPPPGSSGAH
jgi:peptidoglycan/xylan/chitin deacetylase (PgdA/CDA1 family)